MTVLSQVKGLVERMKKYAAHEDDEFWSENDNRGDIFSEGHDQGCAHVAKEALALLPAIEAQQEYIEKLESVRDELLRIEASMVAADDKDAARLHPHWGHSLGVVINRLYGPRYGAIVITIGKPADTN